MFDKRFSRYIFAALMAFFMSFFMSLFMTLVNVGMTADFLSRWARSFGIGVCIAFPTALLVAPIARSLAAALTREE